MKKTVFILSVFGSSFLTSCQTTENKTQTTNTETATPQTGQSGVKDETSSPNIVQVAVADSSFYCTFWKLKIRLFLLFNVYRFIHYRLRFNFKVS